MEAFIRIWSSGRAESLVDADETHTWHVVVQHDFHGTSRVPVSITNTLETYMVPVTFPQKRSALMDQALHLARQCMTLSDQCWRTRTLQPLLLACCASRPRALRLRALVFLSSVNWYAVGLR